MAAANVCLVALAGLAKYQTAERKPHPGNHWRRLTEATRWRNASSGNLAGGGQRKRLANRLRQLEEAAKNKLFTEA